MLTRIIHILPLLTDFPELGSFLELFFREKWLDIRYPMNYEKILLQIEPFDPFLGPHGPKPKVRH